MPETDLIAYLDESRKPARSRASRRLAGSGSHYVVAAAVVISGDRSRLRSEPDAVEGSMGRARRRMGSPRFETARPLSSRHRSEHHVRAVLLRLALGYLAREGGVTQVILETRGSPVRGFLTLDRKDHEVLQSMLSRGEVGAGFQMWHADKSEGLLQIPDVVAGARTDFLCAVHEEPYPMLAHRVMSRHGAF